MLQRFFIFQFLLYSVFVFSQENKYNIIPNKCKEVKDYKQKLIIFKKKWMFYDIIIRDMNRISNQRYSLKDSYKKLKIVKNKIFIDKKIVCVLGSKRKIFLNNLDSLSGYYCLKQDPYLKSNLWLDGVIEKYNKKIFISITFREMPYKGYGTIEELEEDIKH